MLKKFFFKAAFLGLMLVTTSVGFAQDLSIGVWGVEHITNDFGDKTGKCRLDQVLFDEDWNKYIFTISTSRVYGMIIYISSDFSDEITDRKASLSFRAENGKVIQAPIGDYFNDFKMAEFQITTEIVSLFKSSSKLKIALNIRGYEPAILEIDCMGFTKAYNEMLNCK